MTEAMYDILTRAVIEVRKGAFDFDSKEGRSLGWTPIQFWAVMKQLAISDSVSVFLFERGPAFISELARVWANTKRSLVDFFFFFGNTR